MQLVSFVKQSQPYDAIQNTDVQFKTKFSVKTFIYLHQFVLKKAIMKSQIIIQHNMFIN